MPSEVWTVIVAAGAGDRFGGPKHLAPLGGRRVIDHAVEAALCVSDRVVVVVSPTVEGERDPLSTPVFAGGVDVVTGAATRSGSVRCGLAALPGHAATVLVHDGARPLADEALFERVIAAVRDGAPAVVPVVAVTDSLRRRGGGVVDRADLVAVQTPQGFRASVLREAHDDAPEATDDAALVEGRGHRVTLVEGDPTNLKITFRSDLVAAEALFAARGSAGVRR